MRHLITAVAVAGLFHTCICDVVVDIAGYADLTANDFSNPLSSTTNTSPNLVRNLFARQNEWCTAGSPYVICPTPRTCCNARDSCTPTGCCPKIAETCGGKGCYEPGAVCCGANACKPGGVCKTSSAGASVCCRSVTDVVCDGYCCQSGTTCAGGGLCQRLSLSTSRLTSTTTSRSTSTSRSTVITRSASTSIRTSISTSTRTRTKTTEKCSAPTGVSRRGAGSGGIDYIKVEGESNCVPVLDFFCVPDLLDQMCTSMCQGIRDQRAINPDNVLSDKAILLHRRMGRNAAAGCGNMNCAQRLTYSPLYADYFSMQCDEFPPASSLEGGGPTLTCISWYQNNLGGILLKAFYTDAGLNRAGLPYVIRMNTCDFPEAPVSYPRGSEPRPHPPRSKRETVSVKAAEKPLWVKDPRSEAEGGFVVMPIEAAAPGTYNATLSFSGSDKLKDVAILDSAGDVVWEVKNGGFSGGKIAGLEYKVTDDTQDLFVAARAESSVSVTAEFAATSVPQATGTSGVGSLRCGRGVFVSGIVLALMWGLW